MTTAKMILVYPRLIDKVSQYLWWIVSQYCFTIFHFCVKWFQSAKYIQEEEVLLSALYMFCRYTKFNCIILQIIHDTNGYEWYNTKLHSINSKSVI